MLNQLPKVTDLAPTQEPRLLAVVPYFFSEDRYKRTRDGLRHYEECSGLLYTFPLVQKIPRTGTCKIAG